MNRLEFQKYVKATENALKHQKRAGGVKSDQEDEDMAVLRCDISSKKKNRRQVCISVRNVRDNQLDMTFYCSCDHEKNLDSPAVCGLVVDLARKYRFVKAYIKKGVEVSGEKQDFFIAEYDLLMYPENTETYEKKFAEVAEILFFIFGEFIDSVQEFFEKMNGESKESYDKGNDDITINPNPFD